MARRRGSDADLWVLLLVILFALGGLTAASSAYRGVMTLRYLSGIAGAWYAAYNGSQYYGLWQQAAPALGHVAALVKTGSQEAAHIALEQWLITFDPLGLVRDAIKAGSIDEDGVNLFGEK